MKSYPKIGQFYNVTKYVRRFHAGLAPVEYQGTVKLHGTNSGVRIGPGEYVPQSRNRELTIDSDNFGFAAWALQRDVQTAIKALAHSACLRAGETAVSHVTVYGEWCGRGVQKSVALSELDRMFVALTVRVGDDGAKIDVEPCDLPEDAAACGIYSVKRAPVYSLTIDWMDQDSVEAARVECERLTNAVDQECPFAATFGVIGRGEGIVWKPVAHMNWSELWLKTKGEAHKNSGKEGARVKGVAKKAEGVDEFVRDACTEDRFEQGLKYLQEMDKEIDIRETGVFLGWVCKDVATECADDLVESGLPWKQVQGGVVLAARSWFLKRVQQP